MNKLMYDGCFTERTRTEYKSLIFRVIIRRIYTLYWIKNNLYVLEIGAKSFLTKHKNILNFS